MMLKLRVPHLVAAGVVVALAIGFGIGLGGNDHAARAESPILPDLVTLDTWGSHLQLDIQEVRYRRWRQRHLRLVNEVVNLGLAPLQLEAVSEDCDGDGQRKNDRTAYQRLFYADGSSTLVPVGCMEHHHQHHHWHFEGFARYELWNLDGTSTGRTSDKVSFCVMDVHRHSGSNAAQFTQCGRNAVQGLTPGWGDVYGKHLAGQSIDITGLSNGIYCLVSTANPDQTIQESRSDNNTASVHVTIGSGSSVGIGAPDCAP